MRTLIACLVGSFCVVALSGCPEESSFIFPGWGRIAATDAASYCEERGADVVAVPVTDAEIAEASDACELADETGPCWVGTPTKTEASVVTVDGFIVAVPRDLGPALALCRTR